jgi:hypothetical protein
MLIYAVVITRGETARAEMGDELNDERRAIAKYRRQSLLLLVPLLVPMIALSSGFFEPVCAALSQTEIVQEIGHAATALGTSQLRPSSLSG